MLENIRKLRKEAKVPVVIFDESNLRYYTEVGALAGMLLVDREETLITQDVELADNSPIENIVKPKQSSLLELFKILRKKKIKTVGVDLDHMSYALFKRFQLQKIRLMDVSKKLAEIRAVKSEREIGKIRQACKLADKAMKEAVFYLKPGISERELRTNLLSVLSKCEDVAFSFIVASGPNSEYTHVFPTSRAISEQELVIIDLGVKVDGYCSDLTRTFCIDPTGEQKKLYEYMLKAQRIAIDAISPNIQCGKVYKKVESFFKDKSLLKFWKYGLGHGVGLDVQEYPSLFKDSKDRLKNGMAFTIEPGIHIPTFGGVRIEDTVLLDKKAKKLTESDYSFEV